MKNLFYRFTPHYRLSNNPLFVFETRHLPQGTSAASLLKSSRTAVLVAGAALLLVWLVIVLYSSRFTRYSNSLEFAFMVAGLSVLAGFALDFSSIANALNSISGEITTGRWELLRLTMLTPKQIVAAKHGVAQVRAWRLMTLIVTLRVISMLLIALSVLITFLDDTGIFFGMPVATFIVAMLVSGGIGLLFSLEPYWRMKTVTALGVAASARARQPLSTLLVAVGTLAAFWLGQGFVVGALLLGMGVVITPLAMLEASFSRGVIFSPLVLPVIIAVAMYGFYSIVQISALRRAERFVAQRD